VITPTTTTPIIIGQRISIGDSKKKFCIQSCSKPINYLIALREFGTKYVHNSVGTEPSGRSFNEMVLKDVGSADGGHGASGRGIPHNPMINAGAVMSVSMVYPSEKSRDTRREKVMDVWRKLSGGKDAPIGYSEETYVSESKTADRNWCLGYMMKERKAFPKCFTSLEETLELYFQICSLLSTNDAMAIMASTLANGGLCPLTGEKVFTPEQVRSVLPLMLTCGMYDYSGQWAYDVGIPAKSGVGGCIFMVIPNVGGFSIWSPRLDGCGNSERGVHAATELCRLIKLHNFEVFSGLSQTKFDPSMRRYISENTELGGILFAASQARFSHIDTVYPIRLNIYCVCVCVRTSCVCVRVLYLCVCVCVSGVSLGGGGGAVVVGGGGGGVVACLVGCLTPPHTHPPSMSVPRSDAILPVLLLASALLLFFLLPSGRRKRASGSWQCGHRPLCGRLRHADGAAPRRV